MRHSGEIRLGLKEVVRLIFIFQYLYCKPHEEENNLTNEMNGFGVHLYGCFFFPKLLKIQDEITDTC